MHQVVLTIFHLFWAKMPSQQSISQKRPWLDTRNRPFPIFHQTTPSVNFLTVSPLPLHWLGTGWWCSGHSVAILLLFVFVFFLSYTVSAIAAHLCLVLPLLLFLPMLILYVGWQWAYWACLTFASSWANGLACCYFLPSWPIVPFFLSLFPFRLLWPFVFAIAY